MTYKNLSYNRVNVKRVSIDDDNGSMSIEDTLSAMESDWTVGMSLLTHLLSKTKNNLSDIYLHREKLRKVMGVDYCNYKDVIEKASAIVAQETIQEKNAEHTLTKFDSVLSFLQELNKDTRFSQLTGDILEKELESVPFPKDDAGDQFHKFKEELDEFIRDSYEYDQEER